MSNNLPLPKIALVHDWLIEIGGAERVLKALHNLFPWAPVYCLFQRVQFTKAFLPRAEIRTSRWQSFYRRLNDHKWLIPFLPLAVESLDLSTYDVVISTAQFSKGLTLKPQTLHINYCSSPTRQLWDWQNEYRQEKHQLPKLFIALFQHCQRLWDRAAATRVDHFIANSENTRQRIEKYYRRSAMVIYPPAGTPRQLTLLSSIGRSNYWLIVSRLFSHKNLDIAVKAFQKLEWPLVIIGQGPELPRLRRLAGKSSNIKFLGYQSEAIVQQYYSNCLAFVLPQEEDFGITPLEAMSYGKPVLALARGGALEYIKPGINGEWFEEPREEMLADGARRLQANLASYNQAEIKRTAAQFSSIRFREEILAFVNDCRDGADGIQRLPFAFLHPDRADASYADRRAGALSR